MLNGPFLSVSKNGRNRSCFQNWDMGPQENYIETEENTCVPEVTIDEGPDDGDSFDTAI